SDGRMNGEEVITVDPRPGNAVARRSFRYPRARDLQRLRRRDCPVVVLAEEDHRTAMQGSEVQAFVKIALAGRPLAKTDVTEGPLPFPFQRQANPCRLGYLWADGARADHDPAAAAAEVARRLTSAT